MEEEASSFSYKEVEESNFLFLGIDCSTQSLKASVVSTSLELVASDSVSFDIELSKYNTKGGVCRDPTNAQRVTVSPLMWVEGLELLLDKLIKHPFDFSKVRAISGSGQQHGSVYWKHGAESQLKSLSPSSSLTDGLRTAFASSFSPVWMDHSTSKQCLAIEKALGGPEYVAQLTGSRVHERFTGPQIRKMFEDFPAVYLGTERISLVSSFMASLLVGAYAPIDHSDGAGMNLMDIHRRAWWKDALEATAPHLGEKLGPLCEPHACLGAIHPFFVERYGFSPLCNVIAWSGDNPCSLAGLGLSSVGDIGISLGTSDTVFGLVQNPQPRTEGHVFPSPVDPQSFMTMLCYRNGSLTRQEMRDRRAGGSWAAFDLHLQSSSPLNEGCVGFYFDEPEIQPALPASCFRFKVPLPLPPLHSKGSVEQLVSALSLLSNADEFSASHEVCALVEGQLASMRGHCERLGLPMPPARVIATGGASASPAILRVAARVLHCSIFTAAQTDSASVGAALRALHGWLCHKESKFVPFSQVLSGKGGNSCVQLEMAIPAPPPSADDFYSDFCKLRLGLEDKLLGLQ